MCESIYIGNTQQTFKKIMDIHFSYLLRLLKNGKIYDSFAAHFEQHFKSNTSRTDLCKCMTFKVVNQLNPTGAMRTFMKPDCNLCMEKIRIINTQDTILKVYWHQGFTDRKNVQPKMFIFWKSSFGSESLVVRDSCLNKILSKGH